jgi:nucleoside 2-deoxyribosyltransferase
MSPSCPRELKRSSDSVGSPNAARGFWALGKAFRAAVIVPSYLADSVQNYFRELGCSHLTVLGEVRGSPNVILIADPTEVSDQRYDTLLRDEKTVELVALHGRFDDIEDALIFPGKFSLGEVCSMLPSHCRLHIDVGYDVETPDLLAGLQQPIRTIFISTSSPLFLSLESQSLEEASALFAESNPDYFILKENRGGARLLKKREGRIEALPAQLGSTANSVGVGDVFAATFVAYSDSDPIEAAWRATYSSSAYSQTTCPDLFKRYVERDERLSLDEMRALGGTLLPWHMRPTFEIYLAAPDFAGSDRNAIERALQALRYHNFQVRRPIAENGELPMNADNAAVRTTYKNDYDLLKRCELVFAIPTARDPGTLVEIGLAIEAGIPVVVYDPTGDSKNTMVVAGSAVYSNDLDACLNGAFDLLSRRMAAS